MKKRIIISFIYGKYFVILTALTIFWSSKNRPWGLLSPLCMFISLSFAIGMPPVHYWMFWVHIIPVIMNGGVWIFRDFVMTDTRTEIQLNQYVETKRNQLRNNGKVN